MTARSDKVKAGNAHGLARKPRRVEAKAGRRTRLTDRLTALVECRFDAVACDRRVVADVDDERLDAGVAILTALCAETDHACADPMENALGMEAFFDGLWLNMMLYPTELGRLACRERALCYVATLVPAQISHRLISDLPAQVAILADDEADHA